MLMLESLEFPQMYHRQLVIRSSCQGTGHWLSQDPNYQAWLKGDHRFLWIKGNAGSGKSTLMKHTLEELQNSSTSNPLTIASFFYNASGEPLERSSSGLLQSILYQIFTQNRQLLEDFMIASDSRFVKGRNLKWQVEELMGWVSLRFRRGCKAGSQQSCFSMGWMKALWMKFVPCYSFSGSKFVQTIPRSRSVSSEFVFRVDIIPIFP